MKKILCIFISLTLSVLLLTAACADAGKLPSIDSQLKSVSSGQRVEVGDDLSGYSVLNEPFSDLGNKQIRLIILERRSPGKEFTRKVFYPPFGDDVGFPDDFDGVDTGEPRLWLRNDLMRQLPGNLRASSMKEATHLIIAEAIYFLHSTLMQYDYSRKDNSEPPEFETTEEMVAYFLEHQPEISSVAYYPVFGSYAFITFYETETGHCAVYDSKYSAGRIFSRNPDASMQWFNMSSIKNLMDLLTDENGVDAEKAKAIIDAYADVPQEKKDLWTSCINVQEYATAWYSVSDYYWKMAEELKNMDDSPEHQKYYDLILQDRNETALNVFVQFCDYSGFDDSMESIEESGAYIAAPDWDWLNDTMKQMVKDFFT